MDRAKKNVFFYTWLESDSGKGSNEIVSALSHFFENVVKKRIAKRRYKRIRLFSDCCPGQNKNTAMLLFLMRLMADPQIQRFIPVIEYFFPIKGHSYLPPDRVFAKIEKRLRKMTVIKTPAEYHKVLEEHGKLFVLGDDWHVYDMKQLAASALTSIQKVGMKKNRVWTFSRKTCGQVSVQNHYATFVNKPIPLLKPGVNLKTWRPKLIKCQSHVSDLKKTDVRKLLRCVQLTPSEERFYNTELDKPGKKTDDNVHAVPLPENEQVNNAPPPKQPRGKPKKTLPPLPTESKEVSDEPTPLPAKRPRGRPKKTL